MLQTEMLVCQNTVTIRALPIVKFHLEVVPNCHRKLQKLAEHYSITLKLVPSHSEISGNQFV